MSKKSVLIIEDDRWLADQFSRLLKNAGFKTSITQDAWGAIQAVDDFKYDIIVLDILLIGSTGFALLNELQSYSDTADIPIIVCTNIASDLLIEDLKPYGVKRILDKTKMIPGDLLTAVRSIDL
jgi:DNA-binding response OmpR family regulator